jgi:hypothetical protein
MRCINSCKPVLKFSAISTAVASVVDEFIDLVEDVAELDFRCVVGCFNNGLGLF